MTFSKSPMTQMFVIIIIIIIIIIIFQDAQRCYKTCIKFCQMPQTLILHQTYTIFSHVILAHSKTLCQSVWRLSPLPTYCSSKLNHSWIISMWIIGDMILLIRSPYYYSPNTKVIENSFLKDVMVLIKQPEPWALLIRKCIHVVNIQMEKSKVPMTILQPQKLCEMVQENLGYMCRWHSFSHEQWIRLSPRVNQYGSIWERPDEGSFFLYRSQPMIGENRQLVTNEPVEFEN